MSVLSSHLVLFNTINCSYEYAVDVEVFDWCFLGQFYHRSRTQWSQKNVVTILRKRAFYYPLIHTLGMKFIKLYSVRCTLRKVKHKYEKLFGFLSLLLLDVKYFSFYLYVFCIIVLL